MKFTVRMDDSTSVALRRLATQDGRSCNSQINYLIRQAAVASGLWTPQRPRLAAGMPSKRRQSDGK